MPPPRALFSSRYAASVAFRLPMSCASHPLHPGRRLQQQCSGNPTRTGTGGLQRVTYCTRSISSLPVDACRPHANARCRSACAWWMLRLLKLALRRFTPSSASDTFQRIRAASSTSCNTNYCNNDNMITAILAESARRRCTASKIPSARWTFTRVSWACGCYQSRADRRSLFWPGLLCSCRRSPMVCMQLLCMNLLYAGMHTAVCTIYTIDDRTRVLTWLVAYLCHLPLILVTDFHHASFISNHSLLSIHRCRLDFPDMKFSLYFLGYKEAQEIPEDAKDRVGGLLSSLLACFHPNKRVWMEMLPGICTTLHKRPSGRSTLLAF